MVNDQQLAEAVLQQYRAALERLESAVRLCPPTVWNVRSPLEAPFWQQAMHALFYAHLYLCESDGMPEAIGNAEKAMEQLGDPMQGWAQGEVARLGQTLGDLPVPTSTPKRVVPQDEMIERAQQALRLSEKAAARLSEGKAMSRNPMSWLSGTALDLLLYNLRHIEYHLGQLGSYLTRHADQHLEWR